MKIFLEQLDKFIVYLFGLNASIRPEHVRLSGKTLVISFTEKNQRYPINKKILHFQDEWYAINANQRNQLEQALGKAIAKDLTISFSPTEIKKNG